MRPLLRERARRKIRARDKNQGLRYVLETKTKVYKLDAQVLAEPWAGQKVRVVGTLDPKTNVITVEKIETEAASPRSSPKPD